MNAIVTAPRRLRGRLGLAGMALWGVVIAWIYWFERSTLFLYHWDNAFYHSLALTALEQWQRSLTALGAFLSHWLQQDTNALYTLPLLPALAAIGSDRWVYLAAVASLYLLPSIALMAAISRRLLGPGPPWFLAVAATMAITLPILWRPTLYGYPDVGGVLLLTLAYGLYLRDSALNRWQTPLLMGLALGGAVLFRRHFGYGALTLCSAVALVTLLQIVWQGGRAGRWPLRPLWLWGVRLGLLAAATVATVALIAPTFAYRALTENYTLLYQSYRMGSAETLLFLLRQSGGVALAIALLASLYALTQPQVRRVEFAVLLLWSALWLLVWALQVQQVSVQHALHVLPLWLGVAAAVGVGALWRQAQQRGARWPALVATAALLLWVGQFVAVVSPALAARWERLSQLAVLPTALVPLRSYEEDYPHYLQLAAFLRQQVAHQEAIYVAASSPFLNGDVIKSAEARLVGRSAARLRFAPVAEIDSRDPIPLLALLQSDYVVTSQPPLYHLRPEEQDLVRLTAAAFHQDWPLAAAFEPLAERFQFSSGPFSLALYRRQRPNSSAEAVDALARFGAGLAPLPPHQFRWLPLATSDHSPWLAAGETLYGELPAPRPLGLSYLDPIPGRWRLQGRLDAHRCPVALWVEGKAYRASASESRWQRLFRRRIAANAEYELAESIVLATSYRGLVLQVEPAAALPSRCQLVLRALQMAPL